MLELTNRMACATRRFNAAFTIIPILSRINPIPLIETNLRQILISSSNVLLGFPRSSFPLGLHVKIYKALLPSSILATSPGLPNLYLITQTITV